MDLSNTIFELAFVCKSSNFNRIKILNMMILLKKHNYFESLRPPDSDGIKLFDKDDQATKHCSLS